MQVITDSLDFRSNKASEAVIGQKKPDSMKTPQVLKGNLTFFFNDGFSETLTRNLWFHVFGGSKIETKGGFIETRGFD